MSIRWRLALWFSLVLAGILVLSGLVLNTLLQHYLFSEIDSNLQLYSARVHGTLSPESTQGPLDFHVIHSKLPAVNEFSSPATYIQIIDTTGKVIVKSDNLGDQELPVSPLLAEEGISGKADIRTVAAGDGARLRIMVSPLYFKDQTLLLEVAQSLKPVESLTSQLRLALAGGTLLALLLTVALGAVVVRRALAPVERITRTAASIEESSDLDRRVGYTGPADEVGQLAVTFDHMIEHLGKTFDSQKHFVADASHELRTPLTVIQGNLDLLKRNMGDEDRKESLRAIESETRRMTNIVSDLLLLAEVEAGRVEMHEDVRLKEVVAAEIKRAQPLAGNRKLVSRRMEDLSVRGDTHRLTQLVGNLLSNAIRYTPDGGAITLSVFREGDWARLDVADTGIGIAPENLPHIFDRFYRVDKSRSRAGGGTGLGLAIVKGIAEQHGGNVTVVSKPGQGSTFTVRLKV